MTGNDSEFLSQAQLEFREMAHLSGLSSAEDLTGYRIVRSVSLGGQLANCVLARFHRLGPSDGDRRLVHYTSLRTLASILDPTKPGAHLRSYDSVHLNDPDEGEYLLRNLPDAPPDHPPGWWSWPVGEGDMRERHGFRHNLPAVYLTSFVLQEDGKSDMADNLALWRMYGRDGTGCSISLRPASGFNSFLRVVYDRNGVERTATTLYSLTTGMRRLQERFGRDVALREALGELTALTIQVALQRIRFFYKSSAYEYENECRMVIDPRLSLVLDGATYPISYEYGEPARIRHYCEHPQLSASALFNASTQITLGPALQNRSSVIGAIRAFLDGAGIREPAIRASTIRYRGGDR